MSPGLFPEWNSHAGTCMGRTIHAYHSELVVLEWSGRGQRQREVEEEGFCLERRYIAQCAETCIVLRGADLAHRKTVEDR